jgi:hypothetical protein
VSGRGFGRGALLAERSGELVSELAVLLGQRAVALGGGFEPA